MIVTFFGHASFQRTKQIEQQMLDALEQTVNGRPVEFYLGGYGAFDSFAYECTKRYKQTHPEARLVFVTPYLRQERLEYEKTRYDLIVYPPLENVPLRFAISHRNRYMVEQADAVIAYVEYTRGGAYQAYMYAKRKKKEVFNLAEKKRTHHTFI